MTSRTWKHILSERFTEIQLCLSSLDPFSSCDQGDITRLYMVLPAEWDRLRCRNGRTLLHAAATSPNPHMVPYLTSFSAAAKIANVKNEQGKSAIHLCAQSGVGLMPLLALPGIRVDIRDRYDASALLLAIKEEQVQAVDLLLDARADVNLFAMYAGARVATPLACAVHVRRADIVQRLLQVDELDVDQPLLLGLPD